MKKYIPYSFRLFVKQSLRGCKDFSEGNFKKFAKVTNGNTIFPFQHELDQPIFSTTLSENKIHNLGIAVNEISKYLIRPGEIFSFWNIVGKPTSSKGYKKGRNLVAGKLSEEEGGGLCQLSGIIYHISLISGLEILERYPHSVDIYTDENRFTPLGADATIVYGYKDLRIKNNTKGSLLFNFTITKNNLTCVLCSTEKIEPLEIIFEKINEQEVITKSVENGKRVELEKSFYKK